MRRAFPIGLVALTCVLAVARAEGDKRERSPLLVGVVDLGAAFKGYDRKEDLEKEINATKRRFEEEAREQQAQLESFKAKVDRADADDRPKLDGDLRIKVATFKAEREEWERSLKLDIERMTVAILDEIEREIRAYGKANGFDLILKSDSFVWGDERFQERVFRAQVVTVFHRDEALDVTKQVLERLNAKAKKKAR